jgi:hypothetical protein
LPGEDSWQEAGLRPTCETAVCCCITPVDKRILLFGMAMKVTIHQKVPLFRELCHHLFGFENDRVYVLVGIDPLPVQINTS